MTIASRAVKESKAVADLAVAAAKNQLIEELTPSIRAIVDARLRAGTLGEDIDRLRRAADGHGETEFEEGKDMNKDKFESVASLFPSVNESDDAVDESTDDVTEGFDDMEETVDPVAEGEDMDEEMELSNEELEAVYQESLQLEVDVSKGFSDMAKPHEFGAGAKAQYQSDPANLADYKNGESDWDEVEPPAKKKWTVEQIRHMVRQGMAENKKLKEQNRKLREDLGKVLGKLSETNLLNAKILHVNRFLEHNRLTTEQKRTVIENIDKGTTVKEVKSIYSILETTFKAAGAVSESTARKARGDSQKRRTSGGADPRVIRESADRAEGGGFSRWHQLAGLKKIVNG